MKNLVKKLVNLSDLEKAGFVFGGIFISGKALSIGLNVTTGGRVNLDKYNSVEHLAMWAAVGTYGYSRARNSGLSQGKSIWAGIGAGIVATGIWEGMIESNLETHAETLTDSLIDVATNTGGSVIGALYGTARHNYLKKNSNS